MSRTTTVTAPVFQIHGSCSLLGDLKTNPASYPDSISWYENFERTVLSSDDKVSIYKLSSNEESGTQVVLPCIVQNSGSGFFGASVVRSMSNYYTPLHAPLYAGEPAPELAGKLLQQIISKERPVKIVLFPLDNSSEELRHYKATLAANYWFVSCKVCFYNWYEYTDSGFEHYFSQRPSKLRNTYRRKKNKFDATEGSSIKIVGDDVQLDKYIADFTSVYNKSWKKPEPHPDFIPGLMRLSAQAGELRLGIAYLDDTPVAAQFWIVSGQTAHIFKLAHDRDFTQFSPGTLLMVELMRQVVDVDKVIKVDFLSGDDSYKKDWMSSRQERVVMTAFNPGSAAGLMGITKELLLACMTKVDKVLGRRKDDKRVGL